MHTVFDDCGLRNGKLPARCFGRKANRKRFFFRIQEARRDAVCSGFYEIFREVRLQNPLRDVKRIAQHEHVRSGRFADADIDHISVRHRFEGNYELHGRNAPRKLFDIAAARIRFDRNDGSEAAFRKRFKRLRVKAARIRIEEDGGNVHLFFRRRSPADNGAVDLPFVKN